MTEVQIAQTLDCRGLVCPMPVIKLSKAVKTVDKGAVIEMLATDPGSVPDLEAFASPRRSRSRASATSGWPAPRT